MSLHDLICQLSQFPNGAVGRGEGDGYDRGEVVTEFGDEWWIGTGRQVPQSGGDAIADILRSGVDVAFQIEGDIDEGSALAGDRAQFVNALDGVHRLFDALRHLRFHLLRRSPW